MNASEGELRLNERGTWHCRTGAAPSRCAPPAPHLAGTRVCAFRSTGMRDVDLGDGS